MQSKINIVYRFLLVEKKNKKNINIYIYIYITLWEFTSMPLYKEVFFSSYIFFMVLQGFTRTSAKQ